jgi:hypothetical protein
MSGMNQFSASTASWVRMGGCEEEEEEEEEEELPVVVVMVRDLVGSEEGLYRTRSVEAGASMSTSSGVPGWTREFLLSRPAEGGGG